MLFRQTYHGKHNRRHLWQPKDHLCGQSWLPEKWMVLQRNPGCQVRTQSLHAWPEYGWSLNQLHMCPCGLILWPSFILPPNVECKRPKPKSIICIGTHANIVQECYNALTTKPEVCNLQTRLVLIIFFSQVVIGVIWNT